MDIDSDRAREILGDAYMRIPSMGISSSAQSFAPDEIDSATTSAAGATTPFSRIVRLCSVRDRSVAELRDRLTMREEFDANEVEQALSRAIECGLVDDNRFADSFIRARVRMGKGECVIARDLSKYGIDASNLSGWPEEYGLDDESQMQRALDILNANPPRAKNAWAAAFRKLTAKGYSQSVCTRAARIWAESRALMSPFAEE